MSSSQEPRVHLHLTQSEYGALVGAATSAGLSVEHPIYAPSVGSLGPSFGTSSPPAPEENKKSPTTLPNSLHSEEWLTASTSGTVRCFVSISASGTVTGLSFESSEKNSDSEIRTQWQRVSAQHAHSLLANLIDED